jgi:NAD(P)-dependent dehydrogenase (short-subunit alcohol dehydrogenase family)
MSGAVIIGVGPGIGRSVALRFAREGLPVVLVARSEAVLRSVAGEVEAAGATAVPLTADSTRETELRSVLDRAADRLGAPDVVVHNAALVRPDAVGELSAAQLLETWAVNVGGAYVAAGHVLPGMAQRGSGTFLVTGGMPEPKPGYVSLSLGKAGLRTLVEVLDLAYGPSGVHVASVTPDGDVVVGTALDPDVIAEEYWRLHAQAKGSWEREVVLGPGGSGPGGSGPGGSGKPHSRPERP